MWQRTEGSSRLRKGALNLTIRKSSVNCKKYTPEGGKCKPLEGKNSQMHSGKASGLKCGCHHRGFLINVG
jgi:hypothetical protein